MKIVVPVDFSDLSKVAVRYAMSMAADIGASVHVVHAVYLESPPRAAVGLKTLSLEEHMMQNAREDGADLMREIAAQFPDTPVRTTFHVTEHEPVEKAVATIAAELEADLIVVGTKGATGLEKVLMGSNTARIIEHSRLPVIAVPEFARYKPVKRIVYATDAQHMHPEVAAIVPLARLCQAHIEVLHVCLPEATTVPVNLSQELAQALAYPHISFHVKDGDDVNEAIESHLANVDADLLAMFTHELSFFEKIFGQSLTREMAFQVRVPLLAFKKHEAEA